MHQSGLAVIAVFVFTLATAVLTEEQGYTYNTQYAPSTVNFQDIYSNHLALLADEPVLTTAKEDDSFHLKNLPTHYVEFHPKTMTVPPNTTPSSNSSTENKDETNSTTISSTSISISSTEEPEEISVRVIPIKKKTFQRGVLDLLFPASRVKSFKSVFDTFRRILSNTFR